ncbi:MAG: phosphate ABC transporter substrate-binding protein PstS [Terriglobia bacterium]
MAPKVAGWTAVILAAISLHAQTATDLSQVKNVFVPAMSGGNGAAELHQSLVKQLRKSGKFEVVATPGQADAVLKGSGQIWVKGHITTSPRTPAANRQAIYAGFLSVEVVGADNAVLWSYLVTPSKLSWGSISDNLAENLVREMATAHENRGPSPEASVAQTSLHGAGSTFAAPLYQKWFESFQRQHPDVGISYDAVGSGLGTQLLTEHKVDFAASDVPPSDQGPLPSTAGFPRVASVLGGVVPIYNLSDLTQDLKFTPEALAGIYLGKITKWNDPTIKGANKGAHLPDAGILVIHRSDGSGTTYAWSDYLSKTSAEWKASVGAGLTLSWPVGTGVERNEGVAATVQRTPDSIGYVELVYAIQHQLSFGAVRNASGEFIRADIESLAAAADSAETGNSAAASITNASGKGVYPITTFTFLLWPPQVDDSRKKADLLKLLQWVLTSGQRECSALGYAPLPHDLANRQLQALDSFK